MERIRLKDRGAFGLEMQHRIDRTEDEGFRKHVVFVDDIIADYREKVAADQAKRAPSGQPYYTAAQLQWRRDEHAAEAWDAIQAIPRVKKLDTSINDLRSRLEKRGIPEHNERRLSVITSELEPMARAAISHRDTLNIRARLQDAMNQGDTEVIDVIMNWPGHGNGALLGDRLQPQKLVPRAQQWLQTHTSPKESAQLQSMQTSRDELTNVQRTAKASLQIVDTDLIMLPMSGGDTGDDAA